MEDMLKSITQAEAKAADIRAAALERAADIAARAEAQCLAIKSDCEAASKAYREEQLVHAVEQAQKQYDDTLAEKSEEARSYADGLLKKAENCVADIVRRVCGGCR